jgi:hypothetical protein
MDNIRNKYYFEDIQGPPWNLNNLTPNDFFDRLNSFENPPSPNICLYEFQDVKPKNDTIDFESRNGKLNAPASILSTNSNQLSSLSKNLSVNYEDDIELFDDDYFSPEWLKSEKTKTLSNKLRKKSSSLLLIPKKRKQSTLDNYRS